MNATPVATAAAPMLSERRSVPREHTMQHVSWMASGEAIAKQGLLLDMSETGLAMLTQRGQSPLPGTIVHPVHDESVTEWHRPARVMRVEQLSDGLDLVAARYQTS